MIKEGFDNFQMSFFSSDHECGGALVGGLHPVALFVKGRGVGAIDVGVCL